MCMICPEPPIENGLCEDHFAEWDENRIEREAILIEDGKLEPLEAEFKSQAIAWRNLLDAYDDEGEFPPYVE